ncbi:MAG: NAD+ synthase [Bacteroidota bacterium]
MRIALSQLNFVVGDFEKNTGKMLRHVHEAKQANVDLIVFPELAICGYPPRDFLEFKHFIENCRTSALQLADACTDITAIVGLPTINPVLEGKNLYNSACILQDGKITGSVHKALLPTYDIFDEYRYFEPGKEFQCVEINGHRIALTVCEDLWNADDDPLYVTCPMDHLAEESPVLMINIAASPFDYLHEEQRMEVLRRNVKKYGIPVIYVNHVGAQTELIFDGCSVAIEKNGEVSTKLDRFKEDIRMVDFDGKDLINTNPKQPQISSGKTDRIHDALVLGIQDYFVKQGFKKAILGLSGGIDSALVACLAAEALGGDNVKGLMMPSRYSSSGSVDDSVLLADNLGISTELIPIESIFNSALDALKPAFDGLAADVTEENLQARIRGLLLMAQSNKSGAILLNTSNKSELAVGYGTLYGDMCGGLSVIGDLYKTEVYELCRHINSRKGIIPENILTKAPSAELRPGQKDSDSLPEYDLLDAVLFRYIEERNGPDELIAAGFDPGLVRRVLKMVNANEYKRHQFAPILRVSPKAFGSGRRLPIVGKYMY